MTTTLQDGKFARALEDLQDNISQSVSIYLKDEYLRECFDKYKISEQRVVSQLAKILSEAQVSIEGNTLKVQTLQPYQEKFELLTLEQFPVNRSTEFVERVINSLKEYVIGANLSVVWKGKQHSIPWSLDWFKITMEKKEMRRTRVEATGMMGRVFFEYKFEE